jgi:hypothetical protein
MEIIAINIFVICLALGGIAGFVSLIEYLINWYDNKKGE